MLDHHEHHAHSTTTAARDRYDAGTADDGLAAFVGVRSRLFGIAYRVVGSSAEAEDVVQEVWLRWQATDRSVVVDAQAFLVTTTTRLAINVARSARSRRNTCLEPWMTEPVDTTAGPELVTERGEALGIAVFLLLEKLPPTERAVYVLGHAFDYSYAQIAEMLQLSEANARQLASRARKHLVAERRQPVAPAAQRRLLETIRVAARSGELAALEKLLVTDVACDSPLPTIVCLPEGGSSLADRELALSPVRADRKIEQRRQRRPGLLSSLRAVRLSRNETGRISVRHEPEALPSAVVRRTA